MTETNGWPDVQENVVFNKTDDTEILVQFIGVDRETCQRYTAGGLKIVPGKPQEKLPAEFFDNTNLHEHLEEQAGGPLLQRFRDKWMRF